MRTSLIIIVAFILFGMIPFAKQEKLEVTSSAFQNNGLIPAKYTCEGDDINPPISVTGIPAKAKCLALICHDPDAPMQGGFTHWVMWNVATDGKIPENFKGATQGFNTTKKTGYIGMCPPTGTHHYVFSVYALDAQLTIDKSTDKAALEKAIKDHVVASGTLTGLYKKMK